MDVDSMSEDDQSKTVTLFGRDIRKIPCFKQSMLNGIYGGILGGLAAFMYTSRIKLATNVALGSYMGVTVIYWCYCRYDYVQQKYVVRDLQNILRQKSAGIDQVKEVAHEHQKQLADA
ncbi:hypothetical protein PUN28_005400 [Cardiocondyla obscurior]|uniref:Cytochrome c oxidase assembly protein COX20, mitochondrial n=1 Tax=Cardiocondyla obscurior TaxID=286306 RepID=A0AAW2GKC8_9HYME